MDDHNRAFGQLLSQIEQPLDFAKKYNKLTVPLVLALLPVFFLVPGLADWLMGVFGFYELMGAGDEIPGIVLWGFFGAAVLYLIFCISRINKSKGFQLIIYEKGAVLGLVKKTVTFHFDEFRWAQYSDIMKHTRYREIMASICVSGRTVDIFEKDIPEIGLFVDELAKAYADYAIGKIKSGGMNRITVEFSGGMKLEDGSFVDTVFESKRMSLRNVKSVEIEGKGYKISGILDNGKDDCFYWDFKHLHNRVVFEYVVENLPG
ncbi:MAG: hypothetical protein FWD03_05135 [Defluviitaleaceae bacterium]|nr:hypothetical protein [Defluviitaleaceae bacterium]